jgi:prepilin-type N-terminal cleavage/methylation domain-containing protein
MNMMPSQPMTNTCYRTRGFTLIELIIFILVVSILAVGLFSAFSYSLQGTGQLYNTTRAMQLAQERMELILPQKRVVGFAAFDNTTADPCKTAPVSTLPVCITIPAGFTVDSNVDPDLVDPINYKVITVTVTGVGSATLDALVANY